MLIEMRIFQKHNLMFFGNYRHVRVFKSLINFQRFTSAPIVPHSSDLDENVPFKVLLKLLGSFLTPDFGMQRALPKIEYLLSLNCVLYLFQKPKRVY